MSQKLQIKPIKFIPCKQQVLKAKIHCAAPHRLAMLKLALNSLPDFVIDEREIQRDTPSYMVETLSTLQADYPQHALCLIVGSDVAHTLDQWYQWETIFELAHLIIVARPHYDLDSIPWLQRKRRQPTNELGNEKSGKIILLSSSLLDISAQAIRQQLTDQQSPRFLLPDTVLDYIYQHHLYTRI